MSALQRLQAAIVARFDQILLAAILLAIALPRLFVSACVNDFGADGSYYTDVALNVRDGNGLSTDVSVFHQAFPRFPHPTPVYPLWPLFYGYVARLSDIVTVAVWLPTLLYFVSVLLAYALGERVHSRPLVRGLPLHGGHLFALMLATNLQFVLATARPYTEGLGFVLLFAALLRAPSLWRAPGLRSGLELGLWLIVLFLARSQFLVLAIAAAGAVVVLALRGPRGRPSPVALLAAVAGAVLAWGGVWSLYARWLGTFLPDPSIGTYLRFDSARVSDLLSEVPIMVDSGGPLGRIVDTLVGFGAAFSLHDSNSSYHAMHHGAAYLMPLALLTLLWQWRRWPVWLRFLRGARGAEVAFLHLAAIGLTASLHTVHKVYTSPWVFGSRHAIPSVLFVFLCAIYLIRQRSSVFARIAALFLVVAGLYPSYRRLVLEASNECYYVTRTPSIEEYRPALRAFLIAERQRQGELTVGVERPEAQMLSWRTPNVGFHWLSESTTVRDLELMVRELSLDYVVLFEGIHHVKVTKDPAFDLQFALVQTFREQSLAADDETSETPKGKPPTRVYAPRCSAFPEAPSCSDAPVAPPPDEEGEETDPPGGAP